MHAFLLIAALATSQWTMSDAAPSGTLPAPLVFTGDNAGGVGTIRIRPSDEDAQLVLCEGGNNASPEVCTAFQHYNSSATTSAAGQMTNGYYDSTGVINRYNTSFGYVRAVTSASTTNTSNLWTVQVASTNATLSGDVGIQVTSAGAGTFWTGVNGTVNNDFRGPISNGGSATCNGFNSGATCILDDLTVSGTAGAIRAHGSSASNYAVFQAVDSAGVARANFGYYGASFTDADYADKATFDVNGKTLAFVHATDIGVTTRMIQAMDNASATGAEQFAIYGGGTVTFPQTQTITCADNGGGTNATQTLDPQAHTITVVNNDATGCDVTMQETSAQLGAVAIVCVDPASTATNVNFADVANVFNGAGATVALSQGDCMEIRYFDAANDLWLMVAPVGNN